MGTASTFGKGEDEGAGSLMSFQVTIATAYMQPLIPVGAFLLLMNLSQAFSHAVTRLAGSPPVRPVGSKNHFIPNLNVRGRLPGWPSRYSPHSDSDHHVQFSHLIGIAPRTTRR